jgi:metal-sulfur cluster biosynthetic enzyme
MDGRQQAFAALHVVVDPELDEPITDLGFVRSLVVTPAGAGLSDVKVNLRLPTSFCSPNFAYLMASDAKDALTAAAWTRDVVVELDDHHDSAIINAGLAADAGYRGTFGHEAMESLDELRQTFKRKAHSAAMERCLTALLRADHDRSEESVAEVTLADLPAAEATTAALLRRRAALGLSTAPEALVAVDHEGRAYDDVRFALRRARSTRISIDGNAHFCRGLLRTRYGHEDEVAAGQTPDPTFIPLSALRPA